MIDLLRHALPEMFDLLRHALSLAAIVAVAFFITR